MPEIDKEPEDNTPIVACVTVGAFQENCYLYACPQTHEAVIIDPGDEAESILKNIAELKLVPKYIINTHGHIDHIGGAMKLKAATGAPIAMNKADEMQVKLLPMQAAWIGMDSPGKVEIDHPREPRLGMRRQVRRVHRTDESGADQAEIDHGGNSPTATSSRRSWSAERKWMP